MQAINDSSPFFRQPIDVLRPRFKILIWFPFRMILRFHCFALLNNFCKRLWRNQNEFLQASTIGAGGRIWIWFLSVVLVRQWAMASEIYAQAKEKIPREVYWLSAYSRSTAYTRFSLQFRENILSFLHVAMYPFIISRSLSPTVRKKSTAQSSNCLMPFNWKL